MAHRSKRLLASKVVVVGDARSGKTSLIRAVQRAHGKSLATKKDEVVEVADVTPNSPSYIEEGVLLKTVHYKYGGQDRVLPELRLIDTVAVLNEDGLPASDDSGGGVEAVKTSDENEWRSQRERFRPTAYTDSQVAVVCFSVGDRTSFENVVEKWIPEVTHFCGSSVKLIIVGCKSDLTEEARTVSTDEARECAVQAGAKRYTECSADTGAGVESLLDMLAMGLGTWGHGHSHDRGCVVL